MSGQQVVGTTPAQLVRAPSGSGLYQRITVSGAQATLVSLLSGGVLPTILVPNISGPLGLGYTFGFVDLQPETDPLVAAVRYTDDGQTAPTATLGFIVGYGLSGGWTRIPTVPGDIKLFSVSGAVVNIQVRLGITGTQ